MKRKNILTLSAAFVLILCSCGDNTNNNSDFVTNDYLSGAKDEEPRCQHVWDEGSIISKASCTSPSKIVYTCNLCSETKIVEEAACGHDMSKHEAIAPTENNDGIKEYYTCSYEPGVYYKDIEGKETYNSYEDIIEVVPGKRPEVFVGYDFDAVEVKRISLMNQYVKDYYYAKDDDEEYELIHFIKNEGSQDKFTVDNSKLGTQNLGLSWENDGSEQYTIYFATNKLFTNYQTIRTKNNYLNDGVCVPGRTYYYVVYGENSNDALDFGTLEIENGGARFVYVPADIITKPSGSSTYVIEQKNDYTCGFRDIGGWNSIYGVKTPYGRIYRGAQLHGALERGGSEINAEGKRIASEELGIKTEIDLRGSSESDQTNSMIPGANYVVVAIGQYATFFEPSSKGHIETLLTTLGNENNYPAYFHCTAGADRTGTISFMLNSLLGVNEVDCVKDYEMKSFTKSGGFRYRDYHTAANPSGGLDGTFEKDDSIYAILDKFHTLYPDITSLPELTYKVLTDYVGVDHNLVDNFIKINLKTEKVTNDNKCKVTFLNSNQKPLFVKKGTSLGDIRADKLNGYVFDHFEYEDGTVFDPIKPINEDIKLISKYRKVGGDLLNETIFRFDVGQIKKTHEFLDEKEKDKVEKDGEWRGRTYLYTRSQKKNDYYLTLPKISYSNAGKLQFYLTSHWVEHQISIDDVILGSYKNANTVNIVIYNGNIYADGVKKGTISYNALFGLDSPILKIHTSAISTSGFVDVSEIKGSSYNYESRIAELCESLNKVETLKDVDIDVLNNYKEYLNLVNNLTTYEKEYFVETLSPLSKQILSNLIKTISIYDWGVNVGNYYKEAGTTINLTNPISHNGFNFAYWGDKNGNEVDISNLIKDDSEYYSYYEYTSFIDGTNKYAKKIFTVNYDSYPDLNMHFGDDEYPLIANNTFTRNDYTFKYWTTNKDDVNEKFTSTSYLTDDITVYAVWEDNSTKELKVLENGGINITCYVTFVGTGITSEVIFGKKVSEIEAPNYGDREFAYWGLNGEEFDFNTIIKEDISLVPYYFEASEEKTNFALNQLKIHDHNAEVKESTNNDSRNPSERFAYIYNNSDSSYGEYIEYDGRRSQNDYYIHLPKFNFNEFKLITIWCKNSYTVSSYYYDGDNSTIYENCPTNTYFELSIKDGYLYKDNNLVTKLEEDVLNGTKEMIIKQMDHKTPAPGNGGGLHVYNFYSYKKIVEYSK